MGAILFALWGIECVRQEGSAESASRVELIIREGDVSQTLVREIVSRTSLTEEFKATTQSDLGLVSRPFHDILVQSLKVTDAPSLVLRWPRTGRRIGN